VETNVMRSVLLLLLLLLLPAPLVAEDGNNLLENGDFEGPFQAWNNIPQLQVAAGWVPFWTERTRDYDIRPEYKNANPNPYEAPLYENRVRSGRGAQQYFTSYGRSFAGIYQRVPADPGSTLLLTAWAHAWSSSADDPYTSVDPSPMNLRVGIDPAGGMNPHSPDIVWSAPKQYIDSWGELRVQATVQAAYVTVYLSSHPDYANKHNDIYWDDARLLVVARPLPTPPPMPTATIHPALDGLVRGVGQGPGEQGRLAGPQGSALSGGEMGLFVLLLLVVATGVYRLRVLDFGIPLALFLVKRTRRK
jgi:hypothetical protein